MKTQTETAAMTSLCAFVDFSAAEFNSARKAHRAMEIPGGPRHFFNTTIPGLKAQAVMGAVDSMMDRLLGEGSITGEEFDTALDYWWDLTDSERGA